MPYDILLLFCVNLHKNNILYAIFSENYVKLICYNKKYFNFFSAKSNYAWQLGDEVEARKHAKTARLFVILGVIAGILTWVLSLTLFFTISPFRPK